MKHIHIVYIVLVAALLGGGYWIRSIQADRDSARAEVSSLITQNEALVAQRARDARTLAQAQKRAQTARNAAAEAQGKLNAIQDQAGRDWLSAPVPDSVLDALSTHPR